MRSPFLAPKIDLGAQGDFWMHFGRLSVPFCMLWASFESLWAPFCSLLRPFGYLSGACWYLFAPPPPFWHPFRSIFLLFLMLRICCRFFFIWIACGSVFGRTPSANTILGHPTPQDPQQNYSRISTVGTPTLLGPGRACCRRQLKIDEQIEPWRPHGRFQPIWDPPHPLVQGVLNYTGTIRKFWNKPFPPTPRRLPKSTPGSTRVDYFCWFAAFLFAQMFDLNFRIPFFHLFRFWIDFGTRFGIIFAQCYYLFPFRFRASISQRLLMNCGSDFTQKFKVISQTLKIINTYPNQLFFNDFPEPPKFN